MIYELSEMSLRNSFLGRKCLICGCGPSITDYYISPLDVFTIGVNRIVQYFIPNYLIISDRMHSQPGKYDEIVFDILSGGYNLAFSYQPGTEFKKCDTVHYDITPITTGFEKAFNYHKLPGIVTTTEIAISLALYLGFANIGLIGFDLTGHGNELGAPIINHDLCYHREYAEDNNQSIYMLSDKSLVTTFEYIHFDQFMDIEG